MTRRLLTPDKLDEFGREGYFVLERVLPPDLLAALRAEADHALVWHEREMAAQKTVDRLNYVGEHYFIPGRSRERTALADYLRGELMVELAQALVGPEAYLFIELFVLKMPHNRVPFGWHQDHGYIDAYGYGHYRPNLSIWTALDDVTADNGALEVVSSTRRRFDTVPPHRQDEHGNFVADFGVSSGTMLPVPAGSLVVMSGLLPHRSGLNTSDMVRRAYLCQFSPLPVVDDQGRPIQMAVPLLRNSRAVRESENSVDNSER
jgi:ectoine hydroxylase-related dioxygenase (phytanoyl-CoA dioxygenase family)